MRKTGSGHEGGNEKGKSMGCLWEISCGHCKNLFEAVNIGVCEVTGYRVEKAGDDEFAESCPHYENRWELKEKEPFRLRYDFENL